MNPIPSYPIHLTHFGKGKYIPQYSHTRIKNPSSMCYKLPLSFHTIETITLLRGKKQQAKTLSNSQSTQNLKTLNLKNSPELSHSNLFRPSSQKF